MKITIEPAANTDKDTSWALDEGILSQSVTVSVTYPIEPNADTAVALFAKLLVSYGYHQDSIRDCLSKDLGNEIFGRVCDNNAWYTKHTDEDGDPCSETCKPNKF